MIEVVSEMKYYEDPAPSDTPTRTPTNTLTPSKTPIVATPPCQRGSGSPSA